MVGIRPIYQFTCVQILFPHIKGGAKVADSCLKAIAQASFFQAISAIRACGIKTHWNSGRSHTKRTPQWSRKTTSFKHIDEELAEAFRDLVPLRTFE